MKTFGSTLCSENYVWPGYSDGKVLMLEKTWETGADSVDGGHDVNAAVG